MSKKKRIERAKATLTLEPTGGGLTIDSILAQMSTQKQNITRYMNGEDHYFSDTDIKAIEAATAIISALQDEGINDPEQVRDLIADYNALAIQYQGLHAKFEAGDKPMRLGNIFLCPACRQQMRPGNNHCWNCGHRLKWGVG